VEQKSATRVVFPSSGGGEADDRVVRRIAQLQKEKEDRMQFLLANFSQYYLG
jgi:hypothetical protein